MTSKMQGHSKRFVGIHQIREVRRL